MKLWRCAKLMLTVVGYLEVGLGRFDEAEIGVSAVPKKKEGLEEEGTR